VIAGACATVMKALFEETSLVSGAVTPGDDGKSLVPFTGTALTIGGKNNKLAFNHPMGRNWSGIHYRSDITAGLALGEAVAIAFMQDNVGTFTESFPGFAFTGFVGKPVTISRSAPSQVSPRLGQPHLNVTFTESLLPSAKYARSIPGIVI
jgi:hypothetical protein